MISAHSKRPSGFSLVDFMVGAAIIILIFAVSAKYLNNITVGAVSTDLRSRASQKLRSVAEKIYISAGANFYNLTMTNQDLTGAMDPNINVLATIADIDPQTRTRSVHLAASWKEWGITHTKNLDFQITQMRSLTGAASVKLKVVNSNDPTQAMGGILISATGADGNPVGATTGSDGIAILQGVPLSGQGVAITLDGTSIRSYFDLGGGHYSFTNTIQSGATIAGQTEDSNYRTPLTINLPVKITGVVTDILTNAPVPNAVVSLYPLNPILSYSLSDQESEIQTAANGTYTFNSILPGTYLIWMSGTGADDSNDGNGNVPAYPKYAGLAQPSDGWWCSPSNQDDSLVTVPLTGPATKNFATIQRGSLSGTVHGVTISGSQFVADPAPAADVALKIVRYNDRSYYLGDNSLIDLSGSYAWDLFSENDAGSPEYQEDFTATDGGGNYSFPDVTPKVVSLDYPLNQQYDIAYPRTGISESNPYLPVLVWAPTPTPPWNTADMQFLIARGNDDYYSGWDRATDTALVYPWNGGNLANWNVRVMTNGLNNNSDPDNQKAHPLYVLETSALSNIRGNILVSQPGGGTAAFGIPGTVIVQQDTTGNTYGGFEVVPLTMGQTTNAGGVDSGNGNFLCTQQASLEQSAVIQSMSFYVVNADGDLFLGVYSDNGGTPGTLLAWSNRFTPVPGWNTRNVVTPVTLPAGNYWLAYLPQSSDLSFGRGPGSVYMAWANPISFGSMPATFPSITGQSPSGFGGWSIYASFGNSTNISFNEMYQSNTTINSGQNTYTFAQSLPMPLLPTVGNAKVQIRFQANGALQPDPFFGSIKARKKIAANGDSHDYASVAATSINMSGLNITATRVDTGVQEWSDALNVTNAAFQKNESTFVFGFSALSPLMTIPPGQTVNTDLIVSPSQPPTFASYALQASNDSTDMWRLDGSKSTYGGEVYSYNSATSRYEGPSLRLMQIATTGKIYGTVVDDATGNPILNATVTALRWGYDDNAGPATTTTATAGPGGAYNYQLNNLKFLPDPSNTNYDIELVFTAPGYNEVDMYLWAYNGYTGETDARLTMPSTSDPIGGGSGL